MSASPTQVYQIVANKSVQVGDGTEGSSPMQVVLVGGGVISVAGTANEITASPAQGNVVLSIPTDFRPPGSLALGGALTGAAQFSSLYSNAAGSGNATNASVDMEQTAASTGTLTGLSVASNANSGTGTVAGLQALIGQVGNSNGNIVTTMKGVIGATSVAGAGNVGDSECFYANPVGRSGGGTGTVTNGYGFYCNTFGAGITNKWGVYIVDASAANFFAGYAGFNSSAVGGWLGNSNLESRNSATNLNAISGYAATALGSAFLARVDTTNSNFAAFFYQAGQVGSITTNGTITSYNATSDERLKNWEIPQRDYRTAIEKIWVGDFHWKERSIPDFGIRAQQAWKHFPFAIHRPFDDAAQNWEADYGKFAPLALWGVKDLYRENADLRGAVADLAARLAKLEAAAPGAA